MSILSGIIYAYVKHIEIFPQDVQVYIYSKKYPDIKFITTSELLKMMNHPDIILIDARSRSEYEKGHIKGAVSIPYEEFSTDPVSFLDLINTDKKMIIYCEGDFCELSFKLAELFIELGLKNIAIYVGGYPEWEKGGYPVEKNNF